MKVEKTLEKYLTAALEKLVADILKGTLKNPKQVKFLWQVKENQAALKKRRQYWQAQGKHIPAFLIFSITNHCNLFCTGCYARANGICNDEEAADDMLTAENLASLFRQGAHLGIGFMLLAGGEPLMRPEVIKAAATVKEVIFPILTNGTLLNEEYLQLFKENRNLVPILSLEGDARRTDERRGSGTFQKLVMAAAQLHKNKTLYGVSLTLTRENLREVLTTPYMQSLNQKGCRVVLLIEYEDVNGENPHLSLGTAERHWLQQQQQKLAKEYPSLVLIAFPGDEQHMGGCLAAGRGFFHINWQGRAEACPFSPYGDCNLLEVPLLEAIDSPFFALLRQRGLVGGEHDGACVLMQRQKEVSQCLAEVKENDG